MLQASGVGAFQQYRSQFGVHTHRGSNNCVTELLRRDFTDPAQ